MPTINPNQSINPKQASFAMQCVDIGELATSKQLQAVQTMAHLEQTLHTSQGWSYNDIFDSLSAPHNHVLLMVQDAQSIIGYAIYSKLFETAELYRIGIQPSWQRQGMGLALLTHVIDRVKQDNADTLYLEVDETNTPAVRLYAKLGFEAYHRRQNYYVHPEAHATDAVLMKLTL